VILERYADPVASRQLTRVHPRDQYPASGGRNEPGEHAEQRGLAAP
jgi:hypothetical protein